MAGRRGIRRRAFVVSRETASVVEGPVAMFASLPECEEWAAAQDDFGDDGVEYVVVSMDGADATAMIADNMRFGLRQCYEGATCEEEAESRVAELERSAEWRRHERWLSWLGA